MGSLNDKAHALFVALPEGWDWISSTITQYGFGLLLLYCASFLAQYHLLRIVGFSRADSRRLTAAKFMPSAVERAHRHKVEQKMLPVTKAKKRKRTRLTRVNLNDEAS